ncbi:MAG: NAD(P)H-dependent oxidoreductase [Chitinophagaceae bacterium]|jgi:glutathione-regulated potassium-efflux system ancillary protein KefG|nr:NAD(P)H-dependent oxidoreductase [Chitinophagaceae bacterium]
MARVLILFAHPALERSRVQARMVRHAAHLDGITFRDLYQLYPDFEINVKKEQQLLLEHDFIIWQHPFYWYSAPPLLKQWLDLVLEHNWAYGSHGNALAGKYVFNAISAGASQPVYTRAGRNRFTVREFLAPFEQTARLCKMEYLPPFVVHGTHRISDSDADFYAVQYEQLLIAIVNNRLSPAQLAAAAYLNDLLPIPQSLQSS